MVAATGDAAAALVGRIAAVDGSPAGRTIRTGTPILLTDHGVDHETHADDVPPGPAMIVPLSAGGQTRGAVTIGRHAGRDGFTRADLDMAVSFGMHAAVALALAEARDIQISDARLDDHDRIAFDMHDHVIGELFALGMGLQGLAATTHNPAHVERINTYVDTLDRVISTIRTTIFQLQPRQHDPAGLQTRILGIAEAHTEQLGYRPQLHFAGPLDRVVDEPLAADILAVTREALSNCARHAHASTVAVSVVLDHDLLTMEITDNGRGIGTPTRSSGLSNMRRRAQNHGGDLTVSEPGGGGTQLTWTATAPCPQPGRHDGQWPATPRTAPRGAPTRPKLTGPRRRGFSRSSDPFHTLRVTDRLPLLAGQYRTAASTSHRDAAAARTRARAEEYPTPISTATEAIATLQSAVLHHNIVGGQHVSTVRG